VQRHDNRIPCFRVPHGELVRKRFVLHLFGILTRRLVKTLLPPTVIGQSQFRDTHAPVCRDPAGEPGGSPIEVRWAR